jgi:superoxide dismutase
MPALNVLFALPDIEQKSMFLDYRLAKNEYMSQFWLMRLKWKWAFCLEWIKYSKHSIH